MIKVLYVVHFMDICAIVQSHVLVSKQNQMHRNRSLTLYCTRKYTVCVLVYVVLYSNVQLVDKSLSDRAVATIGTWESIAFTNRYCPW